MLRRAVVDLLSAAPHMQIPVWGGERLIANAPEGWEVLVVKTPTLSRGEGTDQISAETLDAVETAEVYFGWDVR